MLKQNNFKRNENDYSKLIIYLKNRLSYLK